MTRRTAQPAYAGCWIRGSENHMPATGRARSRPSPHSGGSGLRARPASPRDPACRIPQLRQPGLVRRPALALRFALAGSCVVGFCGRRALRAEFVPLLPGCPAPSCARSGPIGPHAGSRSPCSVRGPAGPPRPQASRAAAALACPKARLRAPLASFLGQRVPGPFLGRRLCARCPSPPGRLQVVRPAHPDGLNPMWVSSGPACRLCMLTRKFSALASRAGGKP